MLKNFLKFRKLVKTNIIPSQSFALKYDSYNNLVHSSSNLPDKDHYNLDYLERSEIESRIMKVLSHFENVNLTLFLLTKDKSIENCRMARTSWLAAKVSFFFSDHQIFLTLF